MIRARMARHLQQKSGEHLPGRAAHRGRGIVRQSRASSGGRPPWPANGRGSFALSGAGQYTLKIIDLCAALCYNGYWQANENAS
jgi:hypothetical protein